MLEFTIFTRKIIKLSNSIMIAEDIRNLLSKSVSLIARVKQIYLLSISILSLNKVICDQEIKCQLNIQ